MIQNPSKLSLFFSRLTNKINKKIKIALALLLFVTLGIFLYNSCLLYTSRLTNFVRTCIEILSSLPSVVVGLFGYLIFVVQFQYGFSILSGALALTVFNLSLIHIFLIVILLERVQMISLPAILSV